MNVKETALLLAAMNEIWPQVEVKQTMVHVWAQILDDIDYDDALAAVVHLAKIRATWPSIATIRQHVEELDPDWPPSVESAWADVKHHFGATGREGDPRFKSWYTDDSVREIGWRRLCGMDLAEAQIMFAEVFTRRATEMKRALRGEQPTLPSQRAIGTGA